MSHSLIKWGYETDKVIFVDIPALGRSWVRQSCDSVSYASLRCFKIYLFLYIRSKDPRIIFSE